MTKQSLHSRIGAEDTTAPRGSGRKMQVGIFRVNEARANCPWLEAVSGLATKARRRMERQTGSDPTGEPAPSTV